MTQIEALVSMEMSLRHAAKIIEGGLADTYLPGSSNNVREARAKVIEGLRCLEDAALWMKELQERTALILARLDEAKGE